VDVLEFEVLEVLMRELSWEVKARVVEEEMGLPLLRLWVRGW
jgi:hypothetical protein